MLSQRVRTIEPSATLTVNALRLKLAAEGKEIINFSVGEPDFSTPEFVTEAAIQALKDGWTRYTATPGVPALREQIAETVGASRGESIDPGEVVVTCGAKHACANLFLSVVDPGDEVLCPAPYWVSYPEMIRLAEGIPVTVPMTRDGGYRVTPELLEPHVTPRTSGLILNSPSNPTGAVHSREEIDALVEFAEANDIWILSDEIYDRFVYEGEFASPYSGRGRERTYLIGGVSKTFAMTGWRVGWVIGDKSTIGALSRLQSHTTSNAAAVSQAAAIAALKGDDALFFDGMVTEFGRRRARAIELLSAIDGVSFHRPEGAFYIFLDLSEILEREGLESTTPLCEQWLESAGIALVPGAAFGEPQGVRLSYACSMEDLERGIAALDRALAEGPRAS